MEALLPEAGITSGLLNLAILFGSMLVTIASRSFVRHRRIPVNCRAHSVARRASVSLILTLTALH